MLFKRDKEHNDDQVIKQKHKSIDVIIDTFIIFSYKTPRDIHSDI